MGRWLRLVRREARQEILLSTPLPPSAAMKDALAARDSNWSDRDCLCGSDPEWVLRQCVLQSEQAAAVDDDTLPIAYPHLHFGESLYSALLGGKVHYVGTGSQTCSGAEPLLRDWEELGRLRLDDENPSLRQVLDILRFVAARSEGRFFLMYFIFIDTLNLAVELRGTTQAYLDVHEAPDKLRRLMEFGIELNTWFFRHQQQIILPHNEAASGGHPLTRVAPRWGVGWNSVDAYTLCHPRVYVELGQAYQRELLKRVGGAEMHMHGTALLDLLPHVARLEGLASIQAGNDLHAGATFALLPELKRLRRLAGDVPLTHLCLTPEEFETGIQERMLVGAAHYVVPCRRPEQAERYLRMAREYRAPR